MKLQVALEESMKILKQSTRLGLLAKKSSIEIYFDVIHQNFKVTIQNEDIIKFF